ncbi:MAG: hypothetical protein HC812_08475 [Leptolyngbya sp. RL_3_1]|nr:hypothetical protein [Leptolyngbya sp. RL_3_1]
MTAPLPDELQALAAGYVLGDLSSEEMAQFKQLLETQPELAQTVAALQDTLAMLPYGLPPQCPDRRVRSRLLSNVTTVSNPIPALIPAPVQPSVQPPVRLSPKSPC